MTLNLHLKLTQFVCYQFMQKKFAVLKRTCKYIFIPEDCISPRDSYKLTKLFADVASISYFFYLFPFILTSKFRQTNNGHDDKPLKVIKLVYVRRCSSFPPAVDRQFSSSHNLHDLPTSLISRTVNISPLLCSADLKSPHFCIQTFSKCNLAVSSTDYSDYGRSWIDIAQRDFRYRTGVNLRTFISVFGTRRIAQQH